MGFEQAEAAREIFVPLPEFSTDGSVDVGTVRTIENTIVDAAAGIRTTLYVATTVELMVHLAKNYGRNLRLRFPNTKTFWMLLEGDVTATKFHEQKKRRERIHKTVPLHLTLREILPPPEIEMFAHAMAAEKAIALDDLVVGDVMRRYVHDNGAQPPFRDTWGALQTFSAAADEPWNEPGMEAVARLRGERMGNILLPRPLRPVAEAMAAETDVDVRTLVLRDVVRRYVRSGYETVLRDAPAFADPAWGQILAAECIPQLEAVALQSVLDLDDGVVGRVASIMVDGKETLPSEGERRALPFARHLNRPCVFYGNDSDIFLISLLQVPKHPDHPPVYYYDIARSRKNNDHIIDLVSCARRVPDPENAALALLLGGNDYVPPPDRANMTLCKLAGSPAEGGKRARKDAMLPAFSAVAAVSSDPERLTDLVATRFPARVAYDRLLVNMLVRRAYVAREYYASETAATDPSEETWLANGWRTMREPWTVENMVHYSDERK